VDSKAIAIMIVGLGVIVLIVSSAIGATSDDEMDGVSSHWWMQAQFLPASDKPAPEGARHVPLVEDVPDNSRMACTVSTRLMLAAPRPADRSYCVLMVQQMGLGEWRCGGKVVHSCIGDFPSDDELPPEIQETSGRTTGPAS
jgi:hypothetical protein